MRSGVQVGAMQLDNEGGTQPASNTRGGEQLADTQLDSDDEAQPASTQLDSDDETQPASNTMGGGQQLADTLLDSEDETVMEICSSPSEADCIEAEPGSPVLPVHSTTDDLAGPRA